MYDRIWHVYIWSIYSEVRAHVQCNLGRGVQRVKPCGKARGFGRPPAWTEIIEEVKTIFLCMGQNHRGWSETSLLWLAIPWSIFWAGNPLDESKSFLAVFLC